MPVSHNSNIEYVIECLRKFDPHRVLDVGAGAGKYGHLVRSIYMDCHIAAVEVWKPYIDKFKLKALYDDIYIVDARKHNSFSYDVVIFGDVIEHMTKEEALAIWEKVKKESRYAIISIPVCHCPQGHVHGNPFEEHVKDDWSHEEVMESFSHIIDYKIFDETATYFACFIEPEIETMV
jgi:cyclopropane fatty-acyl-phospholipid synthase-like methyltransferase